MVIAMMTLKVPVPKIATTASAMMMSGKAVSTSMRRWNVGSNQPPK